MIPETRLLATEISILMGYSRTWMVYGALQENASCISELEIYEVQYSEQSWIFYFA